MSELLPMRQINLDTPATDPQGYYTRVQLHIADLQRLNASRDRRTRRALLDRLVRIRFLHVEGHCLCTRDARRLCNAHRFDGWVHAHHVELTSQVDAVFSLHQKRTLFTVAERYQTDIALQTARNAPAFEELRLVQDWLFQALAPEFHKRFDARVLKARDTHA
jgi:hypothetical protein